MVPFKETIQSKEELIEACHKGYQDYQDRKISKNDFCMYFGFIHGEAITKYYEGQYGQLLLDGGFNSGSEAYFSGGINAWKNLRDGKYVFPPLKTSAPETSTPSLQKIYFGNPGSGKSYKVETDTKGKKVFRTTFHPDSDYSTFVGTYKPESDGETIRYTFVPQTFTNAYIEAYKDIDTPVYLIIEEINRGNCAQIFGDLFQLLDRRNDGYSEYPINADKDLRDYIRTELARHKGIDPDIESEGIEDGKLRLPPNLHILATMNTSDQSLFPMDSAFKRRWDWEYVPIQYEGTTSDYITITLSGKRFRWIDFLKAVNDRIRRVTESEDKQLGNYFIKSDIDEKEFKSKVMFYLWSEVCKDEYLTEQNFMRSMTKDSMEKPASEKPTDDFFRAHVSEYEVEEFSFNDLFSDRGTDLLLGFMYSMNVLPIPDKPDKKEPLEP